MRALKILSIDESVHCFYSSRVIWMTGGNGMAKIYGFTRGCVVLVGLGLISACTGPLAASTADPALAPEIYIQKYSSSVVTELLPQGGTTASATMVNDKAVVQSINVSVFPADKLPRLIPGEGGTPVDIAKIGDQTMAYQTTDAANKNPPIMLDFTKGNIQVHLSAYSIAGGIVPVRAVCQSAGPGLPCAREPQPCAD